MWGSRGRLHAHSESGLLHQRKDSLAEIFQIRLEIEERQLDAVNTRRLQSQQVVHHVFRRADYLDVAPQHALLALMVFPGFRITAAARKTIDRTEIRLRRDRVEIS